MQDVVHQPVGQEIQDIHDLLILVLGICFMMINKFIQLADEFLVLNLLGKDLLIIDGLHVRFFVSKMLCGIVTQFLQNCINVIVLVRSKLLLQQIIGLIGIVKQLLMLLIDHIDSDIIFRLHFEHSIQPSFVSFLYLFVRSKYALFVQNFPCFLYFFKDSRRRNYSPQNSFSARTAYSVSIMPAVSTAECMASWGSPMSTLDTDTWAVEILPRVDPPAISERLA